MGNLVIFDLTFLPGGKEFDSNLLENVKIPPYAPCSRVNEREEDQITGNVASLQVTDRRLVFVEIV